jgi:DNA repair protein RadA/Sms
VHHRSGMAHPAVSVHPPNVASMAKPTQAGYHCNECGWQTSKWVGRCGECQAWGSVVEKAAPRSRVQAGPVTSPALPIGEVPIEDSLARSSGVPELDRVPVS